MNGRQQLVYSDGTRAWSVEARSRKGNTLVSRTYIRAKSEERARTAGTTMLRQRARARKAGPVIIVARPASVREMTR